MTRPAEAHLDEVLAEVRALCLAMLAEKDAPDLSDCRRALRSVATQIGQTIRGDGAGQALGLAAFLVVSAAWSAGARARGAS